MGKFRSSQEVFDIMGALLHWALSQPPISDRLRKTNLLVKLMLHDPDAIFVIDCRSDPVMWTKGELGTEADLELAMSSDLANGFWQGRVNLLASLSRREILAKGKVTRAMGLAGILQPMSARYAEILRSKGRQDLIE